MDDERGARPILPNLAIPPDPDLSLPDLGGATSPPKHPFDEYRPIGPPRQMQPPMRDRDEDRPLPPLARAAALATPYGAIAAIALVPMEIFDLVPLEGLAFPLLVMLMSQAAGWGIARAAGGEPITRICLTNMVTLAVILPILAVQASAVRVPYVSNEFETATPVIIATTAAVVAIFGVALLSVGLAWESPDQAALLFVPTALLVPEMLGAPFEPVIEDILRFAFESFVLSAVVAFFGPLAPRVARAFLPAAATGILFLALWFTDRGPTLQPTSGDVVRVLDGVLLVTVIVLVVGVPIMAIGVRRVIWEMRGGRF